MPTRSGLGYLGLFFECATSKEKENRERWQYHTILFENLAERSKIRVLLHHRSILRSSPELQNVFELARIEIPFPENLPTRLTVRFQGDRITDILIDGTSYAQALDKDFDLALSIYSPGVKYTGQSGVWCLQCAGRVVRPRINGNDLRFLPIDLNHKVRNP